MTRERLTELLARVAAGALSPEQALDELRHFPSEELQYATVDHLRSLTQGYPEVVLCEGKTTEQVVGICRALAASGGKDWTFEGETGDPIRGR